MATPQIPPRPNRTQNLEPTGSATMDIPAIPPRPRGKRDGSESPNRAAFARSPLNDPSFIHNGGNKAKKLAPKEQPTLAKRPSVQTLPSIGQEGDEYVAVDEHDVVDASLPEKTKSVGKDLPLHAPTASVSAATAKQRIVGVTRTDSERAAISGIGKLLAENGLASPGRTTSSNGGTRPPSIHAKDDDKIGIPHIGIHVPMYPNAGDVQAPTPSPLPPQGSTGIGYFNNGGNGETRKHTRTASGRQVFHGPPGSYGLHGHGVIGSDPLEKHWYEKHPSERAQETKGEYGPKIQDNRKDYHLSTEDLNKLVHHRIVPSRENAGTPAEEIGYQVSEEYNSRIASGASQTSTPLAEKRLSSSQPHAESPLRQASLTDNTLDVKPLKGGLAGAAESREDLGLQRTRTEEDRWAQEHGYDAPILAADEVAKHEFPEHLQPAVSPEFDRERRRSAEYDLSLRKVSSRPESRSSGLYNLSRNSTREELEGIHTSLDKVQEYEPLFPEDDDPKLRQQVKKPSAIDKRRPDLARHHFPSQDVWEDAPSHVHLSTTVETPELEEDPENVDIDADVKPSTTFEPPEAEAARKETITKEDQQSFLSDHTKKLAKTHLTSAQLANMPTRPGVQRFPSQDIWEDAPDDVHQYASVDTPEEELDRQALLSPEDEKPDIPARPLRAKPTDSSPTEKSAPVIPERPKPQVPVRPIRSLPREANETGLLEKTISGGSDQGPPVVKQKPQVPARPGGTKLAALKAGFMSDLNSRLQLGPQAPKVKEPEKEEEQKDQAPLADARKGRAKGPQRRRPAASPSGASATDAPKQSFTLKISGAHNIFSISDDGELSLGTNDEPSHLATTPVSTITTTTSHPSSKLAFEVPQDDNEASAVPTKAVEVVEEVATEPLAKYESNTSESATQTGQMEIDISSPTGEKEHITIYEGGNAHNGDVVIDNDGVEHVSQKPTSPETVSALVPALADLQRVSTAAVDVAQELETAKL